MEVRFFFLAADRDWGVVLWWQKFHLNFSKNYYHSLRKFTIFITNVNYALEKNFMFSDIFYPIIFSNVFKKKFQKRKNKFKRIDMKNINMSGSWRNGIFGQKKCRFLSKFYIFYEKILQFLGKICPKLAFFRITPKSYKIWSDLIRIFEKWSDPDLIHGPGSDQIRSDQIRIRSGSDHFEMDHANTGRHQCWKN